MERGWQYNVRQVTPWFSQLKPPNTVAVAAVGGPDFEPQIHLTVRNLRQS